MTVTAASFQAAFTEFADTPAASIGFWLPIAQALVDPDAWGTLADSGVSLALAHYLSLGGASAGAGGSASGAAAGVGVMSGKGVGAVTASYDITNVSAPGAGHWNQTTYGTRFADLWRMFGAGGVQL